MEYSKNFNFALPSRDNDVDLADINEISNNFRKIDENAVLKEVGKGLSTNDFTNEEKEKLANALLPENIDQTYSPTSKNAQSGVAVAQELDKKLPLTGGNMSGNLGMGNNDILNVKRIVFSNTVGQWLNMSNCPITNVGEPTSDNHAATKKYVDNRIGSGYESGYEYVTMLDTTLSEEVTTIDIDKIGDKTLNCIEFYVQLDVPNASSVKEIRFNIKRANNSYQSITTELPTLKTTTDSTKHTLVAVKFTQNGSIFWNSFFGGQIANKNISWSNSYPSVAIYTFSNSSYNINADGTTGIRISGLFPSGTIVKVYGKCKLA